MSWFIPDESDPERDRYWHMPTVGALSVIAILLPVLMFTYGLAGMTTDNCSPDEPCPQGDEITQNFLGAAIAAVVLLLATTALPRRRTYRTTRRVLAVAAVLAAVWPLFWGFVLGGPDVDP